MRHQRARLKFVTRFGYGEALPTDELQAGPFEVFGSNGAYASFSRPNTGSPVIIVGRKGSYGKVNWSDRPVFASDTTFVVDGTTTPHSLRWVYWLLQSLKLDEGSEEAAVPGLNREDAYACEVALLPPKAQVAVARFLNRHTADIDALIATKQRLLELLAEKRRAIVAAAVMHGLNPAAQLRPSGIDWLGNIPSHWEVRRIATLFTQRDERSQPELPLLEVSINSGVVVREFSNDKIEGTASDFNTYKVARRGDIAFNKMRMWQGAVGVAPVDGLVSPDYTVAQAASCLRPEYAGLLFRTESFSAECGRNSQGITWDRLRLYWDAFRDIFMPLPPLAEQEAILETAQAQAAKINRLRAAAEHSITLLKERRGVLIAAAVNGQIDVTEVA